MKITFLGTGTSQGVPVIACGCEVCLSKNKKDKRLRSSILVEIGEQKFVIDSGPDFRQQMLTHNVSRLDAIIFTHEHRDHIAGLDDVRAYNFIQKQPMDIYAEERVHKALAKEFKYVFAEKKYPGIPEIRSHYIDDTLFSIDKTRILPIRAFHHQLPVLGFRFGNFAYITDANKILPSEMGKLEKLDYFVINALRKEKHISHYTLSEAIDIAAILKPKITYLTHISHQMGLHDTVNAELPVNIQLAFDGLVINHTE